MKRQNRLWLALSVVAAGVVGFGMYTRYWVRKAEKSVLEAADALVRGEEKPGLELTMARSKISQALSTGYKVTGFDNIGLGFRAYEVKVRVANGDQYNSDAVHDADTWQLVCCTRYPASELR